MTSAETPLHPRAYTALVERLNRFPQGAPPSDALYRILRILFSREEAERVALLPVKPFTAAEAARIWKVSLLEARKTLDGLASRALLLDVAHAGETLYTLPPPMAGFFEFSLMRVRGDIDQKALSLLFHQYVTVEEDFMRALVAEGETQVGRIFINESALPAVDVLDFERASEVIRSAGHMAVGLCYCRHKASLTEGACDAPMEDICMTFNGVAQSLSKHGYARLVSPSEGLDLLQKAYEHNLVQFGENVRSGVSFLCNCCGCCCEAMLAAKRFSLARPINTSAFIPVIDAQACSGCGICDQRCPIGAIEMLPAGDPRHPQRKVAVLNAEICLGCGVCARVCSRAAVTMQPRAVRTLTPANTVHRLVLMALERGGLEDLIFDRRYLWSHRAMGALLGAVLRLSPLQRALASSQVKSRYLEALLSRIEV